MTSKLETALVTVALFFTGFVGGCSDDRGEPACTPGAAGCECNMGACLEGLDCVAGLCSDPGADSDGSGDEAEDSSGATDGSETTTTDDTGSSSGDTSTSMGESDGSGETSMCGPGEGLCGGSCVDLSSDIENCGQCGMACPMNLDVGGCEDGECLPSWTECVPAQDPFPSCDEVCQSFGATCVTSGCESGNIVWYGDLDSCEDDLPTLGGTIPCDLSMQPTGDFYRCCCQQ